MASSEATDMQSKDPMAPKLTRKMESDIESRHRELVAVGARDSIEAKVPVFLTAEIPRKVLDRFFDEANAATAKCEYPDMQSVLLHDQDLTKVDETTPTERPIPDNITSKPSPFLEWDVHQILDWARSNLNRTLLTPQSMIVLDQQTAKDEESCLLISLRGLPVLNEEDELRRHYQIVRSDFESSVVCLKTKDTGCGGSEQLDGCYEGFDGILRNQVRDEWERRTYGGK